jgi:hypothetical protein
MSPATGDITGIIHLNNPHKFASLKKCHKCAHQENNSDSVVSKVKGCRWKDIPGTCVTLLPP